MSQYFLVNIISGQVSAEETFEKPIDVNLIKKVFWLIKFVADYFFVKGMATSGFLVKVSGSKLMTSGNFEDFRW